MSKLNWFAIQKAYLGLLDHMKRLMISRHVKKVTKACVDPACKLSSKQLKEIRDFYAPYEAVTPLFHAFYTEKTGFFSPYYLPHDLHINRIDEFFNPRAESKVMDNKCYYAQLFSGIEQPETVVYRIGGLWFDAQRQLIDCSTAYEILRRELACFVKIATESYGGKGVCYLNSADGDIGAQFEKFVGKTKADIVVQRPIRQHADLARINESSVNTYRILSLLSQDGVKIYSSILRMGVAGAKVDNASSGGITCGITGDGKLKKYAYRVNGERFDRHPTSGVEFDGYQLPGFAEAKKLVEKAHPMVPHFKMVSWDIAIQEDGTPVMIEANLAKGELDFHQLNNGPLFGEDTKKILDEVFGINK